MELSQMLNKLKPYLAIISLQFGYAGMYIVTMVSLKGGMSHWILVVYRHAAAILAVAPFALILERKTRPKMTLSIFLKVLLLGFLEPVVDQNLYYVGMTYTSATFASATVNVLPAITFIMAVIFRLEKVNLKRGASVAKVIGTAITVSGAMVMTLYKGPIVNILPYHPGGDQRHHNNATTSTDNQQHWVTGTILLLCCICSWSAFFIAQSITLKEYPAELSLAALICMAGMVESGVVALIMERDISAWALGFDSRLLAAVYSVSLSSVIRSIYLYNHARGPVFLTAFHPT
ncbi:hypothetical protein Leryth_011608 [Lithospermum erythrorhizon]|nr:hypothetical protein Leryth_011608 [Lithospermum erythrorhizon]